MLPLPAAVRVYLCRRCGKHFSAPIVIEPEELEKLPLAHLAGPIFDFSGERQASHICREDLSGLGDLVAVEILRPRSPEPVEGLPLPIKGCGEKPDPITGLPASPGD
jgi:hypothetical protein